MDQYRDIESSFASHPGEFGAPRKGATVHPSTWIHYHLSIYQYVLSPSSAGFLKPNYLGFLRYVHLCSIYNRLSFCNCTLLLS